jgi:hypothetical protein
MNQETPLTLDGMLLKVWERPNQTVEIIAEIYPNIIEKIKSKSTSVVLTRETDIFDLKYNPNKKCDMNIGNIIIKKLRDDGFDCKIVQKSDIITFDISWKDTLKGTLAHEIKKQCINSVYNDIITKINIASDIFVLEYCVHIEMKDKIYKKLLVDGFKVKKNNSRGPYNYQNFLIKWCHVMKVREAEKARKDGISKNYYEIIRTMGLTPSYRNINLDTVIPNHIKANNQLVQEIKDKLRENGIS